MDPTDLSGFEKAIRPNTKILYGETLGNPDIAVFPFEEIAALGRKYAIPLMIDNTFATPYLCRPVRVGRQHRHPLHHQVPGRPRHHHRRRDRGRRQLRLDQRPLPQLHDAGSQLPRPGLRRRWARPAAFILKARVQILRDFGACQAPFNSWQTIQGIETLSLRIERHVANAQRVAEFLESHPRVSWVTYPGLASHPDHERAKKYLPKGPGAILGFGIKGGVAAGKQVHREPEAVQPPGERRRRQEPGHPPGDHDPQPA